MAEKGDNNKAEVHLNGNGESTNSLSTSQEEESVLRPYVSRRERVRELLHSHKFQVAVIVLVILDCLLVIAELMLDVKILELHEENHMAPHVLHYMSIGILSIFIVEVLVKLYALGLDFFLHKLEVFDAFVVFLSFGLDVAFRDQESITNGFGLVIILRLWRVARILNGVVMSVKTQSERKLLRERRQKEAIEHELQRFKDYTTALEDEINLLRQFLKDHGITDIPPTAVAQSSSQNKISVVAEVNHDVNEKIM